MSYARKRFVHEFHQKNKPKEMTFEGVALKSDIKYSDIRSHEMWQQLKEAKGIEEIPVHGSGSYLEVTDFDGFFRQDRDTDHIIRLEADCECVVQNKAMSDCTICQGKGFVASENLKRIVEMMNKYGLMEV